jgi:hypothetical protein
VNLAARTQPYSPEGCRSRPLSWRTLYCLTGVRWSARRSAGWCPTRGWTVPARCRCTFRWPARCSS